MQQANRHPFLRKIDSIALFKPSEAEMAALSAMPMQVAQIYA